MTYTPEELATYWRSRFNGSENESDNQEIASESIKHKFNATIEE